MDEVEALSVVEVPEVMLYVEVARQQVVAHDEPEDVIAPDLEVDAAQQLWTEVERNHNVVVFRVHYFSFFGGLSFVRVH